MPVKNYLRSAEVTGEQTGTGRKELIFPSMLGMVQSISSLNNKEPFRPGVYTCNNVQMKRTVATSSPGSVSYKAGSWFESASGDMDAASAHQAGYAPLTGGNLAVLPWSEARAQEAINVALAKVMEPDLTLGVTLGELGETLEGLRNPLSSLRKALPKIFGPKYVPKSKLGKISKDDIKRSTKGSLDGTSGTWLEYRYGIAPLISEVQAIIEYISAAIRRFDTNLKTKTSKRTAKTVVRDVRDVTSSYTCGLWVSELMFTETDFYTASVGYHFTRPLTLDETLGMSLLDIPSIVWEITTLSFVLDWFIRVGDWLESLKPVMSSAVNIKGISVSRRITQKLTVTSKHALISYWLLHPVIPGKYVQETEHLERQCRTTDYVSLVPSVNSAALNLTKQLDSVALLYQSLSGRRK